MITLFKYYSYEFFKNTIGFIGKVLFGLSATGLENIPKTGGFIVASNHASYLDPPFIVCVMKRHQIFFAKRELFKIPIVNFFLYITDSIPANRGGFNGDAQKAMIKCLKEGKSVTVFPEGTRTKDGKLQVPKAGAGMLAVMAGVPVVPCYISGSFHPKPFFSKIVVNFLPPFDPNEISASTNKEHYFLVSERIIHDISKIYKDPYAGSSGRSSITKEESVSD